MREVVEGGLAEIVEELYPQADSIMGTSTAGIAHAAIVAYKLGKPMGYVRGSAKDHGRKNQVEGRLEPGMKVVVIEDLISTGGSSIECANVLREAGAEVLGVLSIFTYGMAKAAANFDEAGFAHASRATSTRWSRWPRPRAMSSPATWHACASSATTPPTSPGSPTRSSQGLAVARGWRSETNGPYMPGRHSHHVSVVRLGAHAMARR